VPYPLARRPKHPHTAMIRPLRLVTFRGPSSVSLQPNAVVGQFEFLPRQQHPMNMAPKARAEGSKVNAIPCRDALNSPSWERARRMAPNPINVKAAQLTPSINRM
jgi:hypothetical protein